MLHKRSLQSVNNAAFARCSDEHMTDLVEPRSNLQGQIRLASVALTATPLLPQKAAHHNNTL